MHIYRETKRPGAERRETRQVKPVKSERREGCGTGGKTRRGDERRQRWETESETEKESWGIVGCNHGREKGWHTEQVGE